MRGWHLSLALALAAIGLQGCDRTPPVTRVEPPTGSLPDNAVLTPGAQPPAAAPAQPPAQTAETQAPAATAATETPAPQPDAQAMGAGAGAAPAPQAAAPAAPAAPAAQGTAAPTEMSNATQPPAAGPSSPASAPQKVSALPPVRDRGDAQGAQLLAQRSLLVPVAGVAPTALSDNYEQSRGQRTHEAIDILAPAGTPVLAVDDGHITKLFTSKPGGLTIYQYDTPAQLTYYYAHLQRYAEGVHEGMEVRRGQLIGYVGSTGNADPGAPHLHFGVARLGNPPKWWQGEAVNPYPALSRAAKGQEMASR